MIATNRGMGITGSGEIGVIGGTLGSTVATLSSSSVLLTALGIGAAAGPIGLAVGAAIAAGAAIASALGVGNGCGETCIQATSIVNDAEPILKSNLDAYENGTIDRVTAKSNYASVMTAVQQACGKIPGAAGTNCISDRQTGACKWKANSKPYKYSPEIGSCWNWDNGYNIPLDYPADNAPQSSTETGVMSSLTNIVGESFQGIDTMTLVAAGALIFGLTMIGGKD